MSKYLIVLIILGGVSFLYLKVAEKFHIIDKPNQRSSHTINIIRGGGILFLIAVLIYFWISNFQNPYFVLGISLIAIVSFIDDIKTLSSSLRLPFQFLAIGLCLFQIGYSIDDFLIIIPLLIIGVGFINFYNFMDGINGITGIYSSVVIFILYMINLQEHILNDDLFIYVLLSIIVFGFYNFRKKARMFAGDIGSITLAVLIFFLGTTLTVQLKSPIILLSVIVYGADGILTLFYRKYIKENVMKPHRHHIYQKLVDVNKYSHLKVSVIYSSIQLLINYFVYQYYTASLVLQYKLLVLFAISFSILYLVLFKRIEKNKLISMKD